MEEFLNEKIREFSLEIMANFDPIYESFLEDEIPPLMAESLESISDPTCEVYGMILQSKGKSPRIHCYWNCEKDTFRGILSIMNRNEVSPPENYYAFVLWVRNNIIVGIQPYAAEQFAEFCALMPKALWVRSYSLI